MVPPVPPAPPPPVVEVVVPPVPLVPLGSDEQAVSARLEQRSSGVEEGSRRRRDWKLGIEDRAPNEAGIVKACARDARSGLDGVANLGHVLGEKAAPPGGAVFATVTFGDWHFWRSPLVRGETS